MKRARRVLLPIGALSLILLASLLMMSNATEDSQRFGQLYSVLLAVNALGLITFLVLIVLNVRQLYRDLHARRPGARLRRRMLSLFVALSVSPLLVVYGFSIDFLGRGVDSWFDVRVARALKDALDLSRGALDQQTRKLLKQTEQLAYELMEGPISVTPLDLRALRDPSSTVVTDPALPINLDELRTKSGADELLLLTRKGGIIASSSGAHEIVPNLPSEQILLQLRQGRSYVGLDAIRDAALAVRVVVNVPEIGAAGDPGLLQALYPVASRTNKLADNVHSAYLQYRELSYLRDQLKLSFVMTLTLVLLFSILGAVWAAFYSANRMVAPIQDLAAGTRAIAEGDYGRELHASSQDELGFLVESFNEMTRKIALARDEAKRSQAQVEAQRSYLEAVLGRLSSGVLTLDPNLSLRTANAAASKILGVELAPLLGQSVNRICAAFPYLQPFGDALRNAPDAPHSDWREQVQLFGTSGRQVLMCRGTTLAGASARVRGHVIVFDDITALLQGQRDAAWGEVARRLAHEIKNPLTPIQLSAERLRQKYLGTLAPKEREVLDRLTHTIVQQVETMKNMVNTFSEYARTPQMQPKACRLNELIQEILDLYQNVDRDAVFAADLDPELPVTHADPGRLRQVLNNLIKNALEANEGQSAPPYITVSTRSVEDASHRFVELRIADRGPGVPKELLGCLFEPYITNKPKGTGLGLAIVKKIIEEHGGIVWVENLPAAGACAVIRLPVTPAGAESPARAARAL